MYSPYPDAADNHLAWIGPRAAAPLSLIGSVTSFKDSDDFLVTDKAFDFGFFVVELVQHGVAGVDLIRLIRRRSRSGILALCNPAGDQFVSALDSGADAVLGADAPDSHLLAAIAALRRRAQPASAPSDGVWTLLEERATLQTPDGVLIPLSESDVVIMRCFVEEQGGRGVERSLLIQRLWGSADAKPMDNALHATLYRLRKRMEQAGQLLVPIHAISRWGYEFRAPLVRG